MGEIGIGVLRNTVKIDMPKMGQDTDIVAQGPLLVGGGIGIHFLHDVGDALFIELFEQCLLHPWLDLFQSLGGHLFIEGGEDGLAFGRRQIFKNVGQVRGVDAGQTLVLDAQLDASRGIGLNDIDKLPGNGAGAKPARDGFKARPRQNAFEDPAKCAAQTDLDFSHAQMVGRSLAGPLQINIVDADHFSAVDVDDLAVNEIALQKEIAAFVLEWSERLGRAQLKRACRSLHHFLRGHKEKAGAGLEHDARHPAAVGPRSYHNVFEPASQLPMRVRHRRAKKRGKADTN